MRLTGKQQTLESFEIHLGHHYENLPPRDNLPIRPDPALQRRYTSALPLWHLVLPFECLLSLLFFHDKDCLDILSALVSVLLIIAHPSILQKIRYAINYMVIPCMAINKMVLWIFTL